MTATTNTTNFAHLPATLRLGDLEVNRLGFGAMRLPGPEVWGEPENPERAKKVLRRVIELGINLIDTAWFYGPLVSNRLIRETLAPYPRDLVIATKLGGKRLPNKAWAPFIKPEELRQGCDEDLHSLNLERLDVVHLRYMKTDVPFLESLDALIGLQKQGKIRHIALSNVSVKELDLALSRTPIVAVQNLYNIAGGAGQLAKMTHAEVDSPDDVLEYCTSHSIAFLPFFPLAIGNLGKGNAELASIAQRHNATVAQLGLAWLLARSPMMLPIPGTSSPEHLEENYNARTIKLSPEEVDAIAHAAAQG